MELPNYFFWNFPWKIAINKLGKWHILGSFFLGIIILFSNTYIKFLIYYYPILFLKLKKKKSLTPRFTIKSQISTLEKYGLLIEFIGDIYVTVLESVGEYLYLYLFIWIYRKI